MNTIQTVVGGAVQFDLTLDFEALVGAALPPGLDETYIIYNLAYTNDGAAHDFHAWLAWPLAAAPRRLDIIDVTNETGFSKLGCRIPVPTAVLIGPMNLRFVTAGKLTTGVLFVSVQKASVESPT